MSRRGRPLGRILSAIVLLGVGSGCVAPTVESTGVFADTCDDRVVLVLNLLRIAENEQRFAIYYSDKRDLGSWTLAGTYGGRPRAAGVHGGRLLVFFDGASGGRSFVRAYLLPGGDAAADSGETRGDAPGPRTVEELPFSWTPTAAGRDAKGALWVAGVDDGRIAVARLSLGGDSKRKGWDASFPRGPRLDASDGEASERAPESASRPGSDGTDSEWSEPPGRVRISAGGGTPFVFWSVAAEARVADRIRGALLVLDGASEARNGLGRVPGPEWRGLPEYALPHTGFCAAASSDGTPGLVLSRYTPDAAERMTIRPHRVELRPDGAAWSRPQDLSAARQRFLFGYLPCSAWVQWGGGQLFVRTNTQRVEILERSDKGWRAVVPAGFLALYLTEIEVLLLGAGALLLVIVGGTAFGVRLRRLGRPRNTLAPARPEGLAPIASISRRALAALLDVLVVSGAVFSLFGLSGAPPHPLIPDPRPLLLHFGSLAALAVYGAMTEAAFGATPGKLALGLRVELAGGGRPDLSSAVVRNLLRLVDIIPPYLGAVGLSMMTVTGLRQRLGDLAAGTVVVTARRSPARTEGDRR